MNDCYRKTAHIETRDKGSTLLPSAFKFIKNLLIYRKNTAKFHNIANLVSHVNSHIWNISYHQGTLCHACLQSSLTLILRRSRTGTVWFYTSTSNKTAARPKLYTKPLTRDLKLMYSRHTLVRISINL